MAGVDVTRSAVQKAMSSCVAAATELQKASRNLNQQYAAAGSGWKDSKYKELGSVVAECNAAMKDPIAQLGDCHKTLSELDNDLVRTTITQISINRDGTLTVEFINGAEITSQYRKENKND